MVRDVRDSGGRSPRLRRSSPVDVRGASSHQFPIRSQRAQGTQLPDVVCDSERQAPPMVPAIATAATTGRGAGGSAAAAARGEDEGRRRGVCDILDVSVLGRGAIQPGDIPEEDGAAAGGGQLGAESRVREPQRFSPTGLGPAGEFQ